MTRDQAGELASLNLKHRSFHALPRSRKRGPGPISTRSLSSFSGSSTSASSDSDGDSDSDSNSDTDSSSSLDEDEQMIISQDPYENESDNDDDDATREARLLVKLESRSRGVGRPAWTIDDVNQLLGAFGSNKTILQEDDFLKLGNEVCSLRRTIIRSKYLTLRIAHLFCLRRI